jgi:hypothetical protein
MMESIVHTMRAIGIGDLRLSANYWLLNPDKHPDQNISLSLGAKAPTGDDAATDTSFRPTGPELQPVDSAIEAGDGAWRIIFSGNAFAKVPSFTHGDKGLKFNSVPDQSMLPLWPRQRPAPAHP